MRKNRIALLLGIVLMLSLVLTGCRSAGKTVQPSYEGESFTENFNTPKPTPTPAPEGEAAEKLSTQDALKQKKNMQFVRADAKTDIMGDNEVQNILLIGIDSDSKLSDSMMVLSVNRLAKTLSLVSFYRDSYTYMETEEGASAFAKMNAAYYYGGAEMVVDVIEKDYKIAIDDYALVGYDSFPKLVDALGGVDAIAAPILSSVCVVSLLLSRIFLKEKLSWKTYAFIAVVIVGILLLAVAEEL